MAFLLSGGLVTSSVMGDARKLFSQLVANRGEFYVVTGVTVGFVFVLLPNNELERFFFSFLKYHLYLQLIHKNT